MFDLQATANAIAAAYTGVTTSSGATILVGPTARLPNTLAKGPALLVYPPTGVLDVLVSRLRSDEWDFPVKILIDPLDVPTRSDALYAWLNATRDTLEAHITLGLPYVAWARITAARIALDGDHYGDNKFDVVEYTVRVHMYEPVTTLGA